MPVRGNVDSRVRKLKEGRFAALALALAGIQRLGIDSVPYEVLDPSLCLPAVGQGALALETRADDRELCNLLRPIEHHESRAAVEAERSFLRVLGGGCLAPATAHAIVENGALRMEAAVGDPDGEVLMRASDAGELNDALSLGKRLAERMLGMGAGKLIELARDPKASDGDR
jgi:hydroxymethylbilane synthase